MAESKADAKIAKTDGKTLVHEQGLIGSFIGHGAELAERTAATGFGIARDVRGELHARVSGTLQFVENTQQGVIKFLRSLDERLDKLAGDAIDTTEGIALGIIHSLGDTGQGVTDLAGQLTRPREASRAA